ncbi:MAG: CPBP family intramembrane metalloprotease [Crocinitomicaceae bacterium]|nr:CPBP family intramembrane metalloprotease [Crocinitomicaceae bacterium]
MRKIFARLFSSLWFLGLITLIVFPILAWLILWLRDIPLFSIFEISQKEVYSLPAFAAYGIIFALFIIWFTEHPFFEKSMKRYKNLLSQFKINYFYAVFLAICAGVGEEIFFRGAVQPLLGIILTAFVFVAVHGYYDFKNWKVNLFAIALTGFIVLIGWGAAEYSLWHAILPHFTYDLVLLIYAIRKQD